MEKEALGREPCWRSMSSELGSIPLFSRHKVLTSSGLALWTLLIPPRAG